MNANARILIMLVSVLIASPIQAAHFDDTRRAEIQQSGLSELEVRGFDEVYGRNMGQLRQARRIYIAELEMDEVRFNEPQNVGHRHRRPWYLTDADREWINARYRASLIEAIGVMGGYQLLEEPGTDVMTIRGRLLELSPIAPRDDRRSRDPAVDYYSEGTGDLTIAIDVEYSEQLVLALIDERSAGRFWERNDAFHSKRNVARVFDQWARTLVSLIRG